MRLSPLAVSLLIVLGSVAGGPGPVAATAPQSPASGPSIEIVDFRVVYPGVAADGKVHVEYAGTLVCQVTVKNTGPGDADAETLIYLDATAGGRVLKNTVNGSRKIGQTLRAGQSQEVSIAPQILMPGDFELQASLGQRIYPQRIAISVDPPPKPSLGNVTAVGGYVDSDGTVRVAGIAACSLTTNSCLLFYGLKRPGHDWTFSFSDFGNEKPPGVSPSGICTFPDAKKNQHVVAMDTGKAGLRHAVYRPEKGWEDKGMVLSERRNVTSFSCVTGGDGLPQIVYHAEGQGLGHAYMTSEYGWLDNGIVIANESAPDELGNVFLHADRLLNVVGRTEGAKLWHAYRPASLKWQVNGGVLASDEYFESPYGFLGADKLIQVVASSPAGLLHFYRDSKFSWHSNGRVLALEPRIGPPQGFTDLEGNLHAVAPMFKPSPGFLHAWRDENGWHSEILMPVEY